MSCFILIGRYQIADSMNASDPLLQEIHFHFLVFCWISARHFPIGIYAPSNFHRMTQILAHKSRLQIFRN